MAKGIKNKIYNVRKKVIEEISNNADRGGMYARGLSIEGYAGGYLQALDDVLAALNDVPPSNSRYGSSWLWE